MKKKPVTRLRFWKLLECLTAKEEKEFEKWMKVASHKGDRTQSLFSIWASYRKDHQADPTIDPPMQEDIWEQLRPGVPFNGGELRSASRPLAEQVENFLLLAEIKKHSLDQELLLAKRAFAKNQHHFFEEQVRKVKRILEDEQVRDSKYHRSEYELMQLTQPYAANRGKIHSQEEAWAYTVAFDKWWMIEKMKLAIASNLKDHLVVEEIVTRVESDEAFEGEPTARCYSLLLRLFFGTCRAIFPTPALDEVEAYFKAHIDQLNSIDQFNIYGRLFNHYSFLANSHEKIKELQKLYDWILYGMDQELVFVEGFLNLAFYLNAINVTLRLPNKQEAIAKAYDVLNSYEVSLPEDVRGESLALGKSIILIEEKKYGEASKELAAYQTFRNPILAVQAASNMILARFLDADPPLAEALRIARLDTNSLVRQLKKKTDPLLPENQRASFLKRFELLQNILQARTDDRLWDLQAKIDDPNLPLTKREWLMRFIEKRLEA